MTKKENRTTQFGILSWVARGFSRPRLDGKPKQTTWRSIFHKS